MKGCAGPINLLGMRLLEVYVSCFVSGGLNYLTFHLHAVYKNMSSIEKCKVKINGAQSQLVGANGSCYEVSCPVHAVLYKFMFVACLKFS